MSLAALHVMQRSANEIVFDHYHYAKWISVHLKDIINLEEQHPSIVLEFKKEKFTVQKTLNRFSSMPLDQAHWQLNCNI